MEKITLVSDLSRDITFIGELLAYDRTETGTGRHTNLEVYKTSGGNYGCSKVYETQWQGERDKSLAKLCKTEDEVIAFLGLGKQAKSLYCNLGIDCSINEHEYFCKGNQKQEDEDLNEFDEME